MKNSLVLGGEVFKVNCPWSKFLYTYFFDVGDTNILLKNSSL